MYISNIFYVRIILGNTHTTEKTVANTTKFSIDIVKDGPTHYNEEGILILNLFDFLLKENSLEY